MGMRHRAALCLSEETDAVLLVVSEAEELLFQLVRSLQLALHVIEGIKPCQHREKLSRLAYLLTQRSGSAIDSLDFWSGPALGGHQHRAESDLQGQFTLSPLRRVWQGLE